MSRWRRRGLIALSVLMVLLAVWTDNTLGRRKWFYGRVAWEQTEGRDRADYHGKTFVVTRVLDGDTMDVQAPDGRDGYTRIRLLGIDTPETRAGTSASMHFAAEAAAFTKQAALGKSVMVYLDSAGPTRGKYGRLLTYVKLPDGRFLNEVLLNEGCAYADLRFRHSLFNKYAGISDTARRHKNGLWDKVTPDQLPDWLQNRKSDLPGGGRKSSLSAYSPNLETGEH